MAIDRRVTREQLDPKTWPGAPTYVSGNRKAWALKIREIEVVNAQVFIAVEEKGYPPLTVDPSVALDAKVGAYLVCYDDGDMTCVAEEIFASTFIATGHHDGGLIR